MVIRIDSPEELDEVAEALMRLFDKGYSVVLLNGELGSGKTTLVKAMCQSLGVMEPVSSPTFSLVQEYISPSRGVIFHMDLYRLSLPQDLEQIGFSEYLDSGNLCFVEWPDLGNSYYSMPHVGVDIGVESGNIRNFKITTNDAVDA
jgi:tRNA threonylcarbamoyladenosine biosynthesis protein TsaE